MNAESESGPRRGAGAALERLTAALDQVACQACVGLFAAILVTMILQVAFRYLLNAPLVWTEELARYLYIWACFLGAPIALRRGNHIAITLAVERLPPRGVRLVALATQAAAIFFLLHLAIQGTRLALRSHSLMAITVPIPWSVIYLAAPVSAVLMILETIQAAWTSLAGLGRGA